MSRPLEEQIIVITGASSDIGRATAHLLGRPGRHFGLLERMAVFLLPSGEKLLASHSLTARRYRFLTPGGGTLRLDSDHAPQ